MKTLNQFLDESMGGGVPLTPQELEIQKKMSRLNVRLARKRSQQMQKAKVDDTETAPEQVKEGNKVLFPLGDVHSGESKKKTLVWKKKEKGSSEQVKEGKGYQPEIEHSKLGDAKKKADKKRESKLPPHLQGDAIGKMKKAFSEEDKAFNFVVDKLRKQYGSGVMTKGDKMPEPSAAQKKKNAAIRAKRAKEDHRDPTEKASDGRYSDRHSNRGSD